ncbi:MAG: M42 family metallopeptidase [Eubacterium sp.]|jgi:putative aminopeptidase FrvX
MTDYIIDQFKKLAAIPSPAGRTDKAAEYVAGELRSMGYEPKITNKSGVLACIGGTGHPLVISAHYDIIAGIVTGVKPNGHLTFTNVGGLIPSSVNGENCIVLPMFGDKTYSATCQLDNPSTHVNKNLRDVLPTLDNLEIVLDELVSTPEDVKALGIATGDFVCFDPRTVVTDKGFIKSRHIDDKMGVAILLGLAKAVKSGEIKLGRKVTLFFTSYEENGHGAGSSVPADTDDMIALDMGCVGTGQAGVRLAGSETLVSICVKDAVSPYDFSLNKELVQAAKDCGAEYALDFYPKYSSDADVAMKAGIDARHACVGMGVYASHCYERTHVKGVENTYKLFAKYISEEMPPVFKLSNNFSNK